MDKIRAWTFAVLVAVLATGEWFAAPLPADDPARPLGELAVGNLRVTGAWREVDHGGRAERHAFLQVSGSGRGTVTIRVHETSASPMSRVAPSLAYWPPQTIALDETSTQGVDLGALAEKEGVYLVVLASADGRTFVPLLQDERSAGDPRSSDRRILLPPPPLAPIPSPAPAPVPAPRRAPATAAAAVASLAALATLAAVSARTSYRSRVRE